MIPPDLIDIFEDCFYGYSMEYRQRNLTQNRRGGADTPTYMCYQALWS